MATDHNFIVKNGLEIEGANATIVQDGSETRITSTGEIRFRPDGSSSNKVRISLNTTHISGNLQANGINHSNGVEILDMDHSMYTMLKSPEGDIGLHIGDSGDTGNYYSNTTHHVRSRDATTYFTTTNSSGFNVRSGTIKIDGTTVIGSDRDFITDDKLTFDYNDHYLQAGTNSISFKNSSGSSYWTSNNSVFTLNTSLDLNSDSAQLQFGEDNDMQIYHNGANGEINVATGSFTIDSPGTITLNADESGRVLLSDGATNYGRFQKGGTSWNFHQLVSDHSFRFLGNVSGTETELLKLDSANSGFATFNDGASFNGNISTEGYLDLRDGAGTAGHSIHLPRAGRITFYGDSNSHHSIGSRDISGNAADDLTISSYGALNIDLDSNNNNTSGADFVIASHGSTTPLYTMSGETGDITTTGHIILANDHDLSFKKNDGTSDGTIITRATGDAMRIKYNGNAFIFDALGNHDWRIYNSAGESILTTSGMGTQSSSCVRVFGQLQIGTTTVIDNSRNLVNIGTINTGQGNTEVYLMNQNVRSSDSPTFADLTVTGNLNITGDINSYNVTDLDVTDKTITVGAGQTEANSGGSGLIVGGSGASILWDESNSEWDFNNPLSVVNSIAGDTVLNLTASYASSGNVALLGFARSGGAVSGDIRYLDATTEMEIGTSTAHSFSLKTSNTKRLTIDSSGNATFSGSVEINHNPLILDTNPATTYGVSEALRIDDNAGNSDRQLQFFELSNAGARSHRLAFNTNITTNGSAYTYTQGNYGGSSAIHFGNSGEVVFYVNGQVTSGSTDAITPTERFRVHSDGKVKITGSGTIGGNTPTNGYLQITDGSNTLAFDNNEIHTTDNLYLNAEDGIIYLRGNDSGAVTLKNGAITFMDTTRNLSNIGTISSGAITTTGIFSLSYASPVLKINDTDATTATNQIGYISFQRQGSEKAWIGYGSTNNDDFTIRNTEGDVTINANGLDISSGSLRMGGTSVIDSNRQIYAKSGTQIGEDGTYSGYGVVGFGGITNGYNRIFGRDDVNDGLFLAPATGRKVFIRSNGGGGGTDDMNLGFDDTYASYRAIGFGTSSANGVNKVFAHPSGSDGIYIAAATGRQISFRTNGSASDTFTMTPAGEFKVGATVVLNSSRNLTNIGTISSGAITTSGNLTFSPNGDYYAGLGSTNALHFENSSGQTLMSTASVDIRIDANNSDTNRFFSVSHNSSSNATSGGTDLFKITEDGNATFAGNISHTGLTPTSGTDIDQIKTVTVSATLSTSWQDTGIDGGDLSSGTYIVQVFVDDHSVGGQHYDEYYSGVMSWFSTNTNSTKTDEILLHRAGHAPNNGDFFLRTERTVNADSHDLMLQMRGSTSNTGNSNYVFKFRRMI